MAAKQIDTTAPRDGGHHRADHTGASGSGNRQYQEDLSVIRRMMERSSRFISLSGLSGIAAGLIALAGGGYALMLVRGQGRDYLSHSAMTYSRSFYWQLMALAVVVLVLALAAAVFFTVRKSKKAQLKIWTATTRQLLISLFVPLVIGGVACLALIYQGQMQLLAPATLIFYGLALMMASKYTYQDIYYLGISEAILGLVSLFIVGYGLIFWILGFGVLHITYGILMQKKYR